MSFVSYVSQARILLSYIISSAARNKRSTFIGFLTVFTVVLFLTYLQNALSLSPFIFVKFAQENAGQFDFLLYPAITNTTKSYTLNYTSINASLAPCPDILGSSPRWLLPVTVLSKNITNPSFFSTSLRSAPATVIVWDSNLEDELGIGSMYPYRKLNVLEISMTSSLMRTLGAQPENGDRVNIELNIPSLLTMLKISDPIPSQALSSTFSLEFVGNIPLRVIESLETTYGKFPVVLGNVVVMDMSSLLYIKDSLMVLVETAFPNNKSLYNQLENINIVENALLIVIMMKNRLETYVKDTNEREYDLIVASNEVGAALGYNYPVSIVDVLEVALSAMDFLRIFLNEIFFTVIVILSVLALFLIVSLLVIDVEEKTYEYGMLRTLGLQRQSLINLLTCQSFYFSVPAILFGLVTCVVLFIPVRYLFSNLIGTSLILNLDNSAWAMGISLGLILPLAGILIPIRRALTKTLRDALDMYHKVVFESTIQVQNLRRLGFSLQETTFSILLVLMGFVVYYLIPLSFIFGRLDLFFRILTCILLAMVFGQSLLGQLVQVYLEQALSFLFTLPFDSKLYPIVIKNLSGHYPRNSKTAIMFTLCLSYILFAGAMFSFQEQTINNSLEWSYGADVVLYSDQITSPLPEEKLREYLTENLVSSNDGGNSEAAIVEDFTFVTFDLGDFSHVYGNYIYGLASISSPWVKLYGVEPNFLNATKKEFCMVSAIDSGYSNVLSATGDSTNVFYGLGNNLDNAYNVNYTQSAISNGNPGDIIRYVNSTTIPIIISSSIQEYLYLNIDGSTILDIRVILPSSVYSNIYYLSKPLASLQKAPAMTELTSYVTSGSPAFISMDSYYHLLYDSQVQTNISTVNTTLSRIPKAQVLIRVSESATLLQIDSLVHGLLAVTGSDSYQFLNLQQDMTITQQIAGYLQLFFNAVAIIGIFFCFFVLMLSFTANIRENAWEFGVLRAIGLSLNRVIKVYMYEALGIVVSCIFVGLVVGIFTAITLTLQFNLFLEMPFGFIFPGTIFAFVAVLSVFVALYGSYSPAVEFGKRHIATALKGL